ncbi:hypothetical protein Bca4012_051054 [Brassica carinata]
MTTGVKRVKFEAEIRRPGVKVVCNRENSEQIVKCVLKVECFFVWYEPPFGGMFFSWIIYVSLLEFKWMVE